MRARFVDVLGIIVFKRHALQHVGGGDVLGALYHFLLDALIFAMELRHQRGRAPAVELLELGPRGLLHDEAVEGHRDQHGGGGGDQKLAAKRHGASQTESRFHPPHRDGAQPRMRGPKP